MMKKLVALIAVLALAAFGLAACGGDDDEETSAGAPATTAGVFVGKVDGTYVALVTDGQRLGGAYLCSQESFAWIRPAPLTDGTADLVARRGETFGEASFAGEGASGDVNLAGGSHGFSAKLATGKAGLYRTTSGKPGEAGSSETGWVVLPDGSMCGWTTSITPSGDFKFDPAPSRPRGQVTDFTNPFAT
jgi:hypothetical protein